MSTRWGSLLGALRTLLRPGNGPATRFQLKPVLLPTQAGAGAGAGTTRTLTTTRCVAKQAAPSRPRPPPEEEIEEAFLKGSGPGGQKINKTSSAVQLKHIPTGLVVKSQATRSRTQNRKIARQLLADRLDEMYNGDQSRSAIVGETKRRRAASATKKSRRKYRKLDEEKPTEDASSQPESPSPVPPP